MANRAVYKPDIPYPDKIYEVSERTARHAMDELIRKQSILFRKEEEEKRRKKEQEGEGGVQKVKDGERKPVGV